MITDERVQAVAALGFTARQARFLGTVAVHSGYCLRRQYEAFAGIRYGKNVRAFLDGLVVRGLADRFAVRADRGHIYHLHGRAVYAAIGEPDHRHRRKGSSAQIARKLMLLDAAIRRRELQWFVSDTDKVTLCVEQLHIPRHLLPRRVTGASTDPDSETAYFPHRLPMFLSPGDIPHFVFLAIDSNADPFAAFLRDHGLLLRALARWTVVVITTAPRPGLLPVFETFAASLRTTGAVADDELAWYFDQRRRVDGGNLAQISVFDLRRFRTLRQRFDSPAHDHLYTDWLATGRIGAATPGSPTGNSTGTFITDILPFGYEQFGSLPGVA